MRIQPRAYMLIVFCKVEQILTQRFTLGFVLSVDLSRTDSVAISFMPVLIGIAVSIPPHALGHFVGPVLANTLSNEDVGAMFPVIEKNHMQMQPTRILPFFDFPDVAVNFLQ